MMAAADREREGRVARKMYLPPEWTDEEIADFAAKWNGQPGHSQAEFKRKPASGEGVR